MTKVHIISSSSGAETKEILVLIAGYKGQIVSDTGSFYAPYVPIGLTVDPKGPSLTWRSLLEFLSNVYNSDSKTKITGRLKPEQVQQEMQGRFPGPYTIREDYNPETDIWSWKMVFKNKHEEIIWYLKNSS